MEKKMRLRLLFVAIILVLVLVVLYSGLQILESTVFLKNPDQSQSASKVIIKDGVKYYPRQDITVILLMGINQSGPVVPTQHNHGGAADMVALMVFDQKSKVCNLVNLNRDMMVNMPMLNKFDKPQGSYYGQLAYSHTYGDGMEVSCENVKSTVSDFLNGIRIDHYFSLNMDAIGVLNDAVGGVTVTVVDDFSAVDPQIPIGTVKLLGKHAVNFVQARGNVGDELNTSRMRRHKEYMQGFVRALKSKINEGEGFLLNAYDEVSDYIVTDCSIQVLSRLETDYWDYPMGEVLTVAGENKLGEVYYEFYPDEDSRMDLLLKLFYAPMD